MFQGQLQEIAHPQSAEDTKMQGLAPTLVLSLTALLLAALLQLHAYTLLALSPQSRLHFHPSTGQLQTCLKSYNQSENPDIICIRTSGLALVVAIPIFLARDHHMISYAHRCASCICMGKDHIITCRCTCSCAPICLQLQAKSTRWAADQAPRASSPRGGKAWLCADMHLTKILPKR